MQIATDDQLQWNLDNTTFKGPREIVWLEYGNATLADFLTQ